MYFYQNALIQTSDWWIIGSDHTTTYSNQIFTQFGGYGCNKSNDYLYGISGLQFRLKNSSELSVVYQSYVKDIGWLSSSCDGEENVFQHNKPISSFRLNVIPTTQKQYLIAYWNRDVKNPTVP